MGSEMCIRDRGTTRKNITINARGIRNNPYLIFSFVFLFIFSNLFAYQQYKELTCRTGAIVIVPSAVVKKTPTDNGTDQFVIHEGTKVNITDEGMKDWRGIRLADGREGWIPASQIEKI